MDHYKINRHHDRIVTAVPFDEVLPKYVWDELVQREAADASR